MSRFAGRALDRVYFIFLVMHIPTTLMVDMQGLYPAHWVEGTPAAALVDWYLSMTRDPVLGGVMAHKPQWAWLKTFFYLEGGFQLPCFVLGAWGLWKNDKRVYPLLVAYGASTATTLLPVLRALLAGPEPQPPLNASELGMLLSSYVPFLFIPLAMAIDYGCRLVSIVQAAQDAKRL